VRGGGVYARVRFDGYLLFKQDFGHPVLGCLVDHISKSATIRTGKVSASISHFLNLVWTPV